LPPFYYITPLPANLTFHKKAFRCQREPSLTFKGDWHNIINVRRDVSHGGTEYTEIEEEKKGFPPLPSVSPVPP
jgi:hypothetical protein